MKKQNQSNGANSYNVQIHDIRKGNTVIINPQQNEEQKFARLEVDQNSIKKYSKGDLIKKSIRGFLKILLSCTIGGVGFFADVIGIAQYIPFSVWWLVIPCLLLVIFFRLIISERLI